MNRTAHNAQNYCFSCIHLQGVFSFSTDHLTEMNELVHTSLSFLHYRWMCRAPFPYSRPRHEVRNSAHLKSPTSSCLQLVPALFTAPPSFHLPVAYPSLTGAWSGKDVEPVCVCKGGEGFREVGVTAVGMMRWPLRRWSSVGPMVGDSEQRGRI